MQVRVTGVLIEDSKVLILRQTTDTGRKFSLPGGRVEDGEALGDALVREMHEFPAKTMMGHFVARYPG